jgi:hypothetical protein
VDPLDGIVGGPLERLLDHLERGLVTDAADLVEEVVLRLPVDVHGRRAHPRPLADLARGGGVVATREERVERRQEQDARRLGLDVRPQRGVVIERRRPASPLPRLAGRHGGESRRRRRRGSATSERLLAGSAQPGLTAMSSAISSHFQ